MFETDLGPILTRFWANLAPKMAPKWVPKRSQKRFKNMLIFKTIFDRKKTEKQRHVAQNPAVCPALPVRFPQTPFILGFALNCNSNRFKQA